MKFTLTAETEDGEILFRGESENLEIIEQDLGKLERMLAVRKELAERMGNEIDF